MHYIFLDERSKNKIFSVINIMQTKFPTITQKQKLSENSEKQRDYNMLRNSLTSIVITPD